MCKMMLLQDVINNYHPAYAETWDNWLNMDLEQPTRLLVDRLKNEYAKYGKFDTPVVILPEEYDEEDDYTYRAHVADGMHRIRALYELKEEYVYVADNYDHNANDLYGIVMEYVPGKDNNYFDYEDIFEYLSFRYEDENVSTWLTLTSSSCRNGVERTNLLGNNIEKINLEKIFPILSQICSNFNCVLIGITLVGYDENYEERILKEYS